MPVKSWVRTACKQVTNAYIYKGWMDIRLQQQSYEKRNTERSDCSSCGATKMVYLLLSSVPQLNTPGRHPVHAKCTLTNAFHGVNGSHVVVFVLFIVPHHKGSHSCLCWIYLPLWRVAAFSYATSLFWLKIVPTQQCGAY